jgi:hypothetical protein
VLIAMWNDAGARAGLKPGWLSVHCICRQVRLSERPQNHHPDRQWGWHLPTAGLVRQRALAPISVSAGDPTGEGKPYPAECSGGTSPAGALLQQGGKGVIRALRSDRER